jgi:APA family basic amino acid/polyamine antiporter
MALGVGAIVGTGILTLIGVGAAKADPSVILSFAIAGLICAAAALAYAEMATMIPASAAPTLTPMSCSASCSPGSSAGA